MINLKELNLPIRIYWDLSPMTGVTVSDHQRIAEELVANKILSLQITETAPVFSTSCLTVLDTLKGKNIATSIVVLKKAMDPRVIDLCGDHGVKVVFALTAEMNDLGIIADLAKETPGKPAAGIAFSVNRDNYRALPDLMNYCIEHRISHLLLPMQRLMSGEACFSFSREERKELTIRLKTTAIPSWLKITIHDPFLWRVFYPNTAFPNNGCQAGNTMLYISPGADVYPCPTLPVRIGNLLSISLKEIIHSSAKKDLRKKVLERPSLCVFCGELDQCNGGCRGRAFTMKGSLADPDPACG